MNDLKYLYQFFKSWIALALIFSAPLPTPVSFAQSLSQTLNSNQTPSTFQVTAEDLVSAIAARRNQVIELKEIAEWGKQKGIRIWLGGGSAAGLAHYIKMDLEREWLAKNHLPPKFFDDRFTYNYFDIFRSTQDADIIIDANEEIAQELETFLKGKFNYLQGSKSIWEVRLLRSPRGSGAGEKEPLLDNPNYTNQNTDSHSTGLLELTTPFPGEGIVRDLLDWANQTQSQFLMDVVESKLHFIRNPGHVLTKRYLADQNPEILSVIRAFTKAFQYELKIRTEDQSALEEIIKAFDPENPAHCNDYARSQISKNGLKLFWHSRDVENSWNVLEQNGLRRKLILFGNKFNKTELSQWLDREPLRSYPIGQGPPIENPFRGYVPSFKTARELELKTVSHETSSFLAYENITFSLRKKLNVFSSRTKREKENAGSGDGFYAAVGNVGARGTGFTIRCDVDENAVEGIDFFIVNDVKEGSYVIFRNNTALKMRDDSIEVSSYDYFKLLLEGQLTTNDKGALEKVNFKIKSKLHEDLSEESIQKIQGLFHDEILNSSDVQHDDLIVLVLNILKVAHPSVVIPFTPNEVISFLEQRVAKNKKSDGKPVSQNLLPFLSTLQDSNAPQTYANYWRTIIKDLDPNRYIKPPFEVGEMVFQLWADRVPDFSLSLNEATKLAAFNKPDKANYIHQILTHLRPASLADAIEAQPFVKKCIEAANNRYKWNPWSYSPLMEVAKIWFQQPYAQIYPELVALAISVVHDFTHLDDWKRHVGSVLKQSNFLPEATWESLYLSQAIPGEKIIEYQAFHFEVLFFSSMGADELANSPHRDFLEKRLESSTLKAIKTRESKYLAPLLSQTKWFRESPHFLDWLDQLVPKPDEDRFWTLSSENILYNYLTPKAKADPRWEKWITDIMVTLHLSGRFYQSMLKDFLFDPTVQQSQFFKDHFSFIADKMPQADREKFLTQKQPSGEPIANNAIVNQYIHDHLTTIFPFRDKYNPPTLINLEIFPWNTLSDAEVANLFDFYFSEGQNTTFNFNNTINGLLSQPKFIKNEYWETAFLKTIDHYIGKYYSIKNKQWFFVSSTNEASVEIQNNLVPIMLEAMKIKATPQLMSFFNSAESGIKNSLKNVRFWISPLKQVDITKLTSEVITQKILKKVTAFDCNGELHKRTGS